MPRYIREKDERIPCPYVRKPADVHYFYPNSNLDYNYCHVCDVILCKQCFHQIRVENEETKEGHT